jgi:hypothetical protein
MRSVPALLVLAALAALLCGCLESSGRSGEGAGAGLGALAPYSFDSLGVEFLLPNTMRDLAPARPYAPGFKAGRYLENGNVDPYLSLYFHLADQYQDWLGRSENYKQAMGPVDSSDIMILDRSGRRYERPATLDIGGPIRPVRIIRVVLPANERLFVFEMMVDESGYQGYRELIESMLASIRIDPSKW